MALTSSQFANRTDDPVIILLHPHSICRSLDLLHRRYQGGRQACRNGMSRFTRHSLFFGVPLMNQLGWAVIPSQNIFVFPQSDNPEIAAYGKDLAGTSSDPASGVRDTGVVRGVPMSTMVGPSLKLAHQLETIV